MLRTRGGPTVLMPCSPSCPAVEIPQDCPSLDALSDEVHSLVGIQSESKRTRWQNEGAKPENGLSRPRTERFTETVLHERAWTLLPRPRALRSERSITTSTARIPCWQRF